MTEQKYTDLVEHLERLLEQIKINLEEHPA